MTKKILIGLQALLPPKRTLRFEYFEAVRNTWIVVWCQIGTVSTIEWRT